MIVHPAYHVLNEMTKIFYSFMHYLIIKIMQKIWRQIKSMSQTGTKLSAMGHMLYIRIRQIYYYQMQDHT